jgi:hypothetical protein
MARAKHFDPVHPLRMAEAITEINHRAGAVIAAAHTARDLAAQPDMSAAQLRVLIDQFSKAADDLRAALWPDDEG